MSSMQVIMNFELLPNEILIECFEYLNAPDLFYSFDQLNYRFNELIRTCPLHLDCQCVRKSIFDQFYMKMLSNPKLETQIRSLHLSNRFIYSSYKLICISIETFLSSFSLDDFFRLRSLTLTGVTVTSLEQLCSILPALSELRCLHLVDLQITAERLLSIVPMSKLRTLTIPCVHPILTPVYGILSIKNLTLSDCSLDDLCQLFRCVSTLQYLKIQKIDKKPTVLQNDTYPNDGHAVHLKQLIIYNFNNNFDSIIMLLKQTPNLRSLTISDDNTDMIDAWRWEHLITSSLPQLTVFRFKFSGYDADDILRIFKQFQSDFWLQKHHWYTEYTLESDSAMIYTIPYISDTYRLTPNTKRSHNKLINNINIFNNVSDLKLHQEVISLKNSYYFPNVISLKLKGKLCFTDIADRFLKMEHIHSLKSNINLSNVKHLAISLNCEMESSSVLLQLLKQTPQLSSLDMELHILQSFFDNDELCIYFNKLITKLDIHKYSYNGFNNFYETEKFCRIFSNIEHLTCYIDQLNDLVYLLIHLRNLFMMEIHISTAVNRESFVHQLNNEVQKLERTMNIELDLADSATLYISID